MHVPVTMPNPNNAMSRPMAALNVSNSDPTKSLMQVVTKGAIGPKQSPKRPQAT